MALGVGLCVAMTLLWAVESFVDRKREVTLYAHPHKTLELLGAAQVRFLRQDRDQDGARDFAASLQELEEAGCITPRLAAGEVGNYRYELLPLSGGYAFSAVPVAPVGTQTLYYYMDQTFQVRAEQGRPAGPESVVYYDPHEGLTGAYPPQPPTIESKVIKPKAPPQ